MKSSRPTAVVAMSGGVDSSVAAALAVRQGYRTVGATLLLKHPDPEFSAAQLCASKNDREAVDAVCRTLDIEHCYLEEYPAFEQRILKPAALEYTAGRTPNPCCRCNAELKFGKLLEFARSIGAEKIITGHYARTELVDGRVRLRRGSDPAKDQTYFLYRLTPEELSMVEFPIGNLEKSEVRRIAAELHLATARKPDSQDACFQVPGECFGETLRRLFDLPPRPGRFLYRGREVGRHRGIHRYTIGQRKGLNVALGVPAYIRAIDPESGDIELVTDNAELLCRKFRVADLNCHAEIPDEFDAQVQIRYRSRPVAAHLKREGSGFLITPSQPLRAVTPGQSAVFFEDGFLLGGGIIESCC